MSLGLGTCNALPRIMGLNWMRPCDVLEGNDGLAHACMLCFRCAHERGEDNARCGSGRGVHSMLGCWSLLLNVIILEWALEGEQH